MLFIFLILLSCCHREASRPERFNNIPKEAFWVGGADGGDWYRVDYVHPHKNAAHITIYNDQDGSVIMSKQFILVGVVDTTLEPMFITDLSKQIYGFDGKRIYIKHVKGYRESYMIPAN